jgi:geranylgeranyl pyrophosphate synthase
LAGGKKTVRGWMITRFQEYWKGLKPRLDDAFRRQVAVLLGDTAHDLAYLGTALEGGKRLRGCVVCMVNDALGGDLESAIPRGVAVELIQAATLIHDDFVDQDTVRRNRPALWTLEGARRAVLLGDVIFATTIKMMNDLSRDDGGVVSLAIARVARGAFYEPLNPSKMLREIESNRWHGESYGKIIHLKTGTLFGAAGQLGAIAAESDVKLREKSYRYGCRIGEAYQIADDLQEVKACLSEKSIQPDRMAVLSPIFLYFVAEMRPHILQVLEGQTLDLRGVVLEYVQTAVRRMEHEIDRRLSVAVSEIEADFPSNEYRNLLRKGPWDMIQMMMET